MVEEKLKNEILKAQKSEITEHMIYRGLSSLTKDDARKEVLKMIAGEELEHYESLKEITQEEVLPQRFKLFFYVFICRLFGLTFGLKSMENREELAQNAYQRLITVSPKIEKIVQEEEKHEYELIDLIDEERLKYISSIVLGLNDALVELTGALVGFTLALQNTRFVAIVGLITGIAASMSMSASEYPSTKQEETEKSPLRASVFTGAAYVGVVLLLILPYFIFKNIFVSLSLALTNAILIVLIFTFYTAVAKELSFRKKFLEMAGISLGLAVINFIIGLVIREVFGLEAQNKKL